MAVAGFLGIRGKYLKSRGHKGANEFLGEMIPVDRSMQPIQTEREPCQSKRSATVMRAKSATRERRTGISDDENTTMKTQQ